MALVAIQCKNCGGSLKADTNEASYFCPHRHTSYAMEQNITQVYQTINIERATIINDGSGKVEQAIQNGESVSVKPASGLQQIPAL